MNNLSNIHKKNVEEFGRKFGASPAEEGLCASDYEQYGQQILSHLTQSEIRILEGVEEWAREQWGEHGTFNIPNGTARNELLSYLSTQKKLIQGK